MFCRNLYDSDETNSILEVRLNLYVQFLRRWSHLFYCSWFCKSSCGDASHFDESLILYFLQCRYKNKNIKMRTVVECIEMGMECLTCLCGPKWCCRTFRPNRRRKSGVCIDTIFWQVVAKLFHLFVVRMIGYKVKRKAEADFHWW